MFVGREFGSGLVGVFVIVFDEIVVKVLVVLLLFLGLLGIGVIFILVVVGLFLFFIGFWLEIF